MAAVADSDERRLPLPGHPVSFRGEPEPFVRLLLGQVLDEVQEPVLAGYLIMLPAY